MEGKIKEGKKRKENKKRGEKGKREKKLIREIIRTKSYIYLEGEKIYISPNIYSSYQGKKYNFGRGGGRRI